MDICITLVIPVYNVEKYLCQCLNSVVEQSILFDEVILVNDGSTDDSLKICKEYVSKYNYFKLIDQKNQGLSMARNIGIESAFSEYIMFLDADDYLRLDTVKILKNQLSQFHYDAVFFDAEIICDAGIRYSKEKNDYDRNDADLDEKIWNGWGYFAKCYPQNYIVSACMAVYKKEMLTSANIKFPEGLFFEDNYFSLMVMKQAKCVIHISQKLYQRRYRENSIMTSEYSGRKFIDYIRIFLLIANEICQIENSILTKLKGKFLEFISDWYNNTFANYYMCIEKNIKLSEVAINLFHNMLMKYSSLLAKLDFNAVSLNLVVLNKMLRNFYYMDNYKFGDRRYIQQKIREITDAGKELYLNILNKIPFNKDCKIGIYGTGKHTEGLLNIFEKLVGEITCDLIFLDSKMCNGKYRGRKIINYQKIQEMDLDLIIISSFLYEKEMLTNIKNVPVNIPLYTFYQTLERDIFSEYEIFLKYC